MNIADPLKQRALRRTRGFTLVEMVITIAVIAILAGVAWPSYESYVRRSKRATAQSALMTIANREQAHLLDLRGYTTSLAALNVSAPQELRGDYAFTIVVDNAASPRTFVATATPLNLQARSGELPLTVSQSGARSPASTRGYWGY
jgi:type IV pilus assembly protein PilE